MDTEAQRRGAPAAQRPPDALPLETVTQRRRSAAEWLLRIAVLGHAIAMFAMVFTVRQTQFGNLLFMEVLDPRVGEEFFGFRLSDPYIAAVWMERLTVSLYLAAALVVALYRPWSLLLLLIAGYALLEAVSGTINAGYRYSEWTVAAHAPRYALPLALMMLVVFPKLKLLDRWRVPTAAMLLRLMIATVFITHGAYALAGHPGFIDLIIGSGRHLLGMRVSESAAVLTLQVIGVVDLCVALAVLIYPRPVLVPRRLWAAPCAACPIRRMILPALLLWLALWGLVTALSRMTSLGYPGGMSEYTEVVVRTSHVLAPLALLLLIGGAAAKQARPASDEASAEGGDDPQGGATGR